MARGRYGKADTEYIAIHIEAETLQEARSAAKKIIDDIGHDWLETRVCSEAERMWDNGHPAFFDMAALEGVGQLKGVSQ